MQISIHSNDYLYVASIASNTTSADTTSAKEGINDSVTDGVSETGSAESTEKSKASSDNLTVLKDFQKVLNEYIDAQREAKGLAPLYSKAASFEGAMTESNTTYQAPVPDEYKSIFAEAAETYGVDQKLLEIIAERESGFNPTATSSAGAMGIMQIMPSTAEALGVSNPYDARENIMGGANYIAQKIRQYDGDVSLALAAYNAGSGNVAKYGGIPPFTETQNYVSWIMSRYQSA